MKQVYDANYPHRMLCYTLFPGITDLSYLPSGRNPVRPDGLENLNLRGGFQKDIMDYICKNILTWFRCTTLSTTKRDRSYFRGLEDQAERLAKRKQLSLREQRAALRPGRAWAPGHCRLLLP